MQDDSASGDFPPIGEQPSQGENSDSDSEKPDLGSESSVVGGEHEIPAEPMGGSYDQFDEQMKLLMEKLHGDQSPTPIDLTSKVRTSYPSSPQLEVLTNIDVFVCCVTHP